MTEIDDDVVTSKASTTTPPPIIKHIRQGEHTPGEEKVFEKGGGVHKSFKLKFKGEVHLKYNFQAKYFFHTKQN